ncbi:MAG: hypothetical protein SPK64_04310, partial [Candidatus Enterosoma sp.]|nr:hypothetical protein [Candidatus Enterosoma sp.]
KFDVHYWIIVISLFVVTFLGLYFSIGMSVKMVSGYTLFGSSSTLPKDVERIGPTSSDILVLTIFWISTAIILLTFIYYSFIKKVDKKEIEK